MRNLRILMLAAVSAVAAGLLFVNIYNSLVDTPNWGSHFPDSILAARAYYSHAANPGTFFRIFSPLNQVLTLLALIICWPAGKWARILCGSAVLLAVSADAMTFAYFYPRNTILFSSPIENIDLIRGTWGEWTNMNWVRSALCLTNVILDYSALVFIVKASLKGSRSSGDRA